MNKTKLKHVGYFILFLIVFVLIFLTVREFFYWWLLASIIGFALLLLYERLRQTRKSEKEGEKLWFYK